MYTSGYDSFNNLVLFKDGKVVAEFLGNLELLEKVVYLLNLDSNKKS